MTTQQEDIADLRAVLGDGWPFADSAGLSYAPGMVPQCISPMFAVLLLSIVGCGPPAIEGGFDSANPAATMYAIEHAARQGDRSAVRKIVEQLDSDDPGVRWMAIGALDRLTGERFGYDPGMNRIERQPAIRRWVVWVEREASIDEERSQEPGARDAS